MSNEPENRKDRLDKTLSEMKQLQKKLQDMSPEQREKLMEKVKLHAGELSKMKSQIDTLSGAIKQGKKSPEDRIANAILLKTDFVSHFRKQRSKREIAEMWSNGWLIPLSNWRKKTSLMQGKGVKVFWQETLSISEDKNLSLLQLGDAWKKSPALALPTVLVQMSSLLCDYFGEAYQTRILPFDAAFAILKRLLVEVQLQTGIDPMATEKLDALGQQWILMASGESPTEDLVDLTLKALLAYGWIASILATSKKS